MSRRPFGLWPRFLTLRGRLFVGAVIALLFAGVIAWACSEPDHPRPIPTHTARGR